MHNGEDVLSMKQSTIARYEKMIAWGEQQPEDKEVVSADMVAAINTCWGEKYCLYCEEDDSNCSRCALSGKDRFSHYRWCCDGLWILMFSAKTWGEWVIQARKVRDYIEEHG